MTPRFISCTQQKSRPLPAVLRRTQPFGCIPNNWLVLNCSWKNIYIPLRSDSLATLSARCVFLDTCLEQCYDISQADVFCALGLVANAKQIAVRLFYNIGSAYMILKITTKRLISKRGNEIYMPSGPLLIVRIGEVGSYKYSLVSPDGTIVLPAVYDGISYFSGDKYVCKNNGRCEVFQIEMK